MSRYVNAQIRGLIYWEVVGFKLPEIAPTAKALPGQNGRIQLVVRSIRSTIGMAGLPAKIDMGAISLQKGQSSSDHDHIGCPSLISLSPSFVRHASTVAMLRCFSAHARFHATALSPPSPLSRASTRNDPRYSYVASFSCGRCLSVAPLDLHVKIILMCIDHQLPFPPYAAALRIIKSVDHQGVLPPLFSSSSPLPSLPPAFLPQVQVCVNANDAFVGQIAGPEERARIVDAICARGGEMMMHQCVPILSASSWRYVDHPPALC
ncbi:hypothetical protein B0H13DRAFT_2341553 [Mycena leptocephala]|nr:hypothetical protein B0H13DRAFT_2341553 [Mycena leptocephala]